MKAAPKCEWTLDKNMSGREKLAWIFLMNFKIEFKNFKISNWILKFSELEFYINTDSLWGETNNKIILGSDELVTQNQRIW